MSPAAMAITVSVGEPIRRALRAALVMGLSTCSVGTVQVVIATNTIGAERRKNAEGRAITPSDYV
jgi:hypothetical protein